MIISPDARLLDAKLLLLFDALYRTGSVTRTAEQLGQSQPTISIWLSHLRRELSDPLFIRTPSGMQPTPRADALIGTARQALEALRQLSAAPEGFDPANARRRFRICMTDGSHVTLLPHILRHVRAAAPGVRIEAAQINSETARALQSGEADLALGFIPELEAGFFQQALYPQDWVCLVNHAHPRIADAITVEAYQAEEHIGIVFNRPDRHAAPPYRRNTCQLFRPARAALPDRHPRLHRQTTLACPVPPRTGEPLVAGSVCGVVSAITDNHQIIKI